LTNYNILVFDQTMKNNSSVSLVNTNVWRSGGDYDANVTAALFDLNNKTNMWNFGGKAAVSNLIGIDAKGETRTGYNQTLRFGKRSGRFTFEVWQDLTDTKYSSNDMGYFTNNNYLDHGVYAGYRWTEPKKWYNRIFINFNASYSKLFSPIAGIDEKYQRSRIQTNINVQSKKLWWAGLITAFIPRENDFYEPRWEGRYFKRGNSATLGAWFESNAAKKYSFYIETFNRKFFDFYDGFTTENFFRQSFRFSSKFSLTHRLNVQQRFNNMGYAWSSSADDIIFGKRKVNAIENILSAKYNFNNKQGITFRMRHYTSSVDYKSYYNLLHNGNLEPNNAFNINCNQNVNFFNIDMVYTWQFAPGSFINIVWKNAVYDFNDDVENNYFKNFDHTLDASDNNNISFKIIYFLDYLQLKKKKK